MEGKFWMGFLLPMSAFILDRDKEPGIMCKLDLEKAYDRVDWGDSSFI